jgi:hypothetical protein
VRSGSGLVSGAAFIILSTTYPHLLHKPAAAWTILQFEVSPRILIMAKRKIKEAAAFPSEVTNNGPRKVLNPLC